MNDMKKTVLSLYKHEMTWGEFKKAVETLGVSDGMKIDYIDVGGCEFTLSVEIEGGTFSVTS